MFTGIVQAMGQVRAAHAARQAMSRSSSPRRRLGFRNVAIGDSIAVNGCCLTVTRIEGDSFAADASRETLNVTTLA